MDENAKKLGKILLIMLVIIGIIIMIFLISSVFNINLEKPNLPGNQTTTAVNHGFHELTREEKIIYNAEFNDTNLLLAFGNLHEKGFQVKDINLLESEVSKFKFIYTYLNPNKEFMTLNEINELSRRLFDTNLNADNLTAYWLETGYKYQISLANLDYCFKVKEEKEHTLLIDIINSSETNCNINVVDYESALIKHQVKITYARINNNYIYKTFVVVS